MEEKEDQGSITMCRDEGDGKNVVECHSIKDCSSKSGTCPSTVAAHTWEAVEEKL
jgi:hypothetical protein